MKEVILGLTAISDPAVVSLGANVGERSRPIHPAVLSAAVPLDGKATVKTLDHVHDNDDPVDDHRPRHYPPFGYTAEMVRTLLVLAHMVGMHRGEVISRLVIALRIAAASLASQVLLLKAMSCQAGMCSYCGPDGIRRTRSHLHTHHFISLCSNVLECEYVLSVVGLYVCVGVFRWLIMFVCVCVCVSVYVVPTRSRNT